MILTASKRVLAVWLGVLLLGVAGKVLAATAVTESPGTTVSVYRGTSVIATVANYAACVERATQDAATRVPGTYSYGCQDARDRLSIKVTADPLPQPVNCEVSAWSDWQGGAWSACANGQQSRTETRSRTVTRQPANGGQACPALTETRTATQACTTPPPAEPVQSVNVFGSSTPSVAADSDTGAVELGMRFRASVNGTVTGIRFYKGTGNTGTHVGNLWTASGQKLASVTFTGETATGWQQAQLATPVTITAGQTYVVSYHAPRGRYAVSNPYAWPRAAGTLTGIGGVFKYGVSAFPDQQYGTSNYWVDVVVVPGAAAPPPVTPPQPPAVSIGTASLTWEPPTTYADGKPLPAGELAGYRVYRGASPSLLNRVAEVTATAYEVTQLAVGTHYFAATAVATDGTESAFSNIASKVIR